MCMICEMKALRAVGYFARLSILIQHLFKQGRVFVRIYLLISHPLSELENNGITYITVTCREELAHLKAEEESRC